MTGKKDILRKITVLLTGFFAVLSLFSQRGKEGALLVAGPNIIVNEYTYLTADAAAGTDQLTVNSSNLNFNGRFSTALAPGDLVMIIQMQGASIWNISALLFWGEVKSYNNCGNYEFAEVLAVPNNSTITLSCDLKDSYTASGKVQVVRIPRYTNLIVNPTGELTCQNWNGTTGGILAVEVLGSTLINPGGKMDASGKGFRGGVMVDGTSNLDVDIFRSTDPFDGAEKGEGIAGYGPEYDLLNGRYGRGAAANGGGGGNAHNGGGGGGANAGDLALWTGDGNPQNAMPSWTTAWNLESPGFATSTSTGGGRGGYTYSSVDRDATTVGTGDPMWGGDWRRNHGGKGGRPLFYFLGKIFMGGGGGAGDINNNSGGNGGNGGGIIYLLSYGGVSGSGEIRSDGNPGGNSTLGHNDGPGGGGGGGAIIVNAIDPVTSVSIFAHGGAGGNQLIATNESEGPGGGGGGGYIAISGGTPTRQANGGINGNTSSAAMTEFSPNGATAGGAGLPNESITNFNITGTGDTICSGGAATLTATLSGDVPPGTTIEWFDEAAGGSRLFSGPTFITPPVYSTDTFYAGGCPGTFRVPLIVHVLPTPNAQPVGALEACPFSTNNAWSTVSPGPIYNWSVTNGAITAGQGTNSITVSWSGPGPATVQLTEENVNGCDTTATVDVNIRQNPTPVITGPSTVCAGDTSVYSTPFIPFSNYWWTVSGGTLIGPTNLNFVSILWENSGGPFNLCVTEVDGFLCDTSACIPGGVSVQESPAAEVSGPTAACINDTVQFSTPFNPTYIYAWTAVGGTIVGNSNQSSIDVFWSSPGGPHAVCVLVTNPVGCDSTACLSGGITINTKPAFVIAGNSQACEFDTATFSVPSVPGDAYSWSVTGGSIVGSSTENTVEIAWGAAGAGTVCLTQTAPGGCSFTDCFQPSITIQSNPTPLISPVAGVCENAQGITYCTPDDPASVFLWTVSGGGIVGNNDQECVTINWGVPGTGAISVSETNTTTGCSSTALAFIPINELPSPSISPDTNICAGSMGNRYCAPLVLGNTYSWTVTGGVITTSPLINCIWVNWFGAGNDTLRVVETVTATGCSGMAEAVITKMPKPSPFIAGATNVCERDTIVYSALFALGHTYDWTVAGAVDWWSGPGPTGITVVWGTAGVGSIIMTETNPNGCDSTVIKIISVQPKPSPFITGEKMVCEHNNETYTTGFSPTSGYDWTVTGGAIVSGAGSNSVVIQWDTAGTGTISVREFVVGTGCDSLHDISVTIYPKPSPIAGPAGIVCQYNSKTYIVLDGIATSFNWTVVGGTFTGGGGSITVDWGAPGLGVVQVQALVDSTGCDSTIQLNIPISFRPMPVIGPLEALDICEFETQLYEVPIDPGHTYSWSATGGTIVGSNTDPEVLIKWGNAGGGTISLTETDIATGCDTTVSTGINILPNPEPSVAGPVSVCEYTTVGYTASATPGMTYNWWLTGGTVLTGQGTNDITISWDAAGFRTLALTQTDTLSGCDSTIFINITVNPRPLPDIQPTTGMCAFSSGNIYCSPANPGFGYTWTVTGGSIIGGNSSNCVTVDWGQPGPGTLTVNVQDQVTGCDTTQTINFLIFPNPTPVISPVDTVCAYTKGVNYCTPDPGASDFIWTVTGGAINGIANGNCVTLDWSAGGNWDLSVTETFQASGCDTTVTVQIPVIAKPEPAFTVPAAQCEFTKGAMYCTPAVPATLYNWAVVGGVVVGPADANCVTIDWGPAGFSALSITAVDSISGCDSVLTKTTLLTPIPEPEITGDFPACEYSEKSYCTVATGNTYAWSVTGGTILSGAGTNCIMVKWGSSGMGNVTVMETSPQGCDTTVSMMIPVDPRPEPFLTGPDTLCEHVLSNYCTVFAGTEFFNWVITGGAIITGQGTNCIDVIWAGDGVGEVMLTQTFPGTGCDSIVTMEVQLSPRPEPHVFPNGPVCAFTPAQLYCTPPVPGDIYHWALTGGTIVGSDSGNCVTVNWGPAGIGEFTLSQTVLSSGCDSTITQTVRIDPRPMPSINPDSAICEYTNGHIYCTPDPTGSSFFWSAIGGNIPGPVDQNCVNIDWGLAGIGTVDLVETIDSSGCDSSVNASIPIHPKPRPVISGPLEVCEYSPDTSYSTPFVAGVDYSWAVIGGTIESGQGTNQIVVSWGLTGNGMVQVWVTNATTQCDTTVSVGVIIHPRPEPSIDPAVAVCEFTSEVYCTPASGNGFSWNVTGGNLVSGAGTECINVDWGGAGVGGLDLVETIFATGCDTAIGVTIPINTKPAPAILPDTAICEYSSHSYSTPAAPGDLFTWTISGGQVVAGQGTENIVVDWGVTGIGSISLTQSIPGSGCDTTVAVTIPVFSRPDPVILPDTAMCEYSSETYCTPNVPGNAYQWIVTGGTIIGSGTLPCLSVKWGGQGTGVLSLRETILATGCDTLTTLSIALNPNPEPEIIGPVVECEYRKDVAYSTAVNPGRAYVWTVTGGQIDGPSDQNAILVDWGTAGAGTISLTEYDTITGTTGCDSTVSVFITLHPNPSPSVDPDTTVCENSCGNTYCTPATGNDFAWTAINGTVIGPTNLNCADLCWGMAGTGTLSLNESISATGCDTTIVVNISLDAKPVPVIFPDSAVCNYTTGHVYSVPLVIGDSYSWNVTGGNIVGGQGTNNIVVDWGATGMGQVCLTQSIPVTNCDSTVCVDILILTTPQPAITPPDPICEYTNAVPYCTPEIPGNTYSWTVTGGAFTGGLNTGACISVDWFVEGMGTLCVSEFTPASGCDTTVCKDITINPRPIPSITPDTSVCEFTNGHVYCAPLVPGNMLNWNVSGGGFFAGPGGDCITVDWGPAGNGIISLTETISATGCDTAILHTIAIDPKPRPVISPSVPVCEYSTRTYCTPFNLGNTYSWQVTGGIILSGQGNNCINIEWHLTGMGTVSVTELNPITLCDTTVEIFIPKNPRPTPDISPDSSICEFTSGHIYCSADVVGNTYSWGVAGGNFTPGPGPNCITVNWGATGWGTLQLTETIAATGCDTTIVEIIEIDPKPRPDITPNSAVCEYTVEQYCTDPFPGNTYVWSATGGTILSIPPFGNCIDINWGIPGMGTVSVTQSIDSSGCDTTVDISVTINPKPRPEIFPDTHACVFATDTFTVLAAAGNTYSWTTVGGTFLTGANSNAIIISWGGPGPASIGITQTNPFGCDTTVSLDFEIYPTPAPVISPDTGVCEFSTAQQYCTPTVLGNSFSWTVIGGQLFSPSTGNCINVNWGPAGTGSLFLTETVDTTHCDTTVAIDIPLYLKPRPEITPDTSECEYELADYSTPPFQGRIYDWVVTGGNIIAGQNTNAISVEWGPVGTAIICLTETENTTGCDTTVCVEIIIDAKPDPIISGSDTVCEYTTGYLYCSPAMAGHSYFWTVTGGMPIGPADQPCLTVDWFVTGAGVVCLTEWMDSSLCDTSECFDVWIHPRPEPVISPDTSVCEFTGSHQYCTPLVAGNTYSWAVTGGNFTIGPGLNCASVHWGAGGTGTLTLTETIAATGCDTSFVLDIQIDPIPDPVITPTADVCEYTFGHQYCTPAIGGTAYNWTISGGQIVGPSDGDCINVKWFVEGTGTLCVQQFYLNSLCDTSVCIDISIHPRPNPMITGPDSVCEYTNGSVYTTPASGNTFTWEVSGGVFPVPPLSTWNEVDVNWGIAAGGWVSVLETNNFNCDTIYTFDVKIGPIPNPEIIGPDSLCAWTVAKFWVNPSIPGGTVIWDPSPCPPIGPINNDTVCVMSGPEGIGNISIGQESPFGCDTTVSMQITILPNPSGEIQGESVACAYEDSICYTAVVVDGEDFGYDWGVNNGDIFAGQGTPEICLEWHHAGFGLVQVNVTHENGCDTLLGFPVTLLDAPLTILQGLPEQCEDDTVTYCVSEWPNTLNLWEIISGDGTIVGPLDSGCVSIAWNEDGPGTVNIYQVNATTGCSDEADLDIIIHPGPSFTPPTDFSGCAPLTVDFDLTPADNWDYFQWDFGDGVTDIDLDEFIRHIYEDAGTVDCEVTAFNDYGCSDSAIMVINVLPTPEAAFEVEELGFDNVFLMGESEVKTINLSVGDIANWEWEWGDGFTDIPDWHASHVYESDGPMMIQLIVESPDGCADTAWYEIMVEAPVDVFIPNAFTPNGDGNNDYFEMFARNITNFEIMIFDRWGKMVFSSPDKHFQWAGDFRGKHLSEGVYTWLVKAQGEGKPIKMVGTVTLIR